MSGKKDIKIKSGDKKNDLFFFFLLTNIQLINDTFSNKINQYNLRYEYYLKFIIIIY